MALSGLLAQAAVWAWRRRELPRLGRWGPLALLLPAAALLPLTLAGVVALNHVIAITAASLAMPVALLLLQPGRLAPTDREVLATAVAGPGATARSPSTATTSRSSSS